MASRTLLKPADGTFTRASVAQTCDGSSMTQVANNVARAGQRLLVSAPEWSQPTGECGADGDAYPWCSNSAGFYATASGDATKLYRSADGRTSWTLVHTFATNISSVFALASGRLIAFIAATGNTRAPYYSDDNGANWTAGTLPEGLNGLVAMVNGWGFDEDDDGIIIAVTYGTGTDQNEVWRSADRGATWTRPLQLDAGVVTHFHAVCTHKATGRKIIDTGDNSEQYTGIRVVTVSTVDDTLILPANTHGVVSGQPIPVVVFSHGMLPEPLAVGTTYWAARVDSEKISLYHTRADALDGTNKIHLTTEGSGTYVQTARRRTYYSDDAGLTWQVHDIVDETPKPSVTGQVTRWRDYGHATRIAYASDGARSISWLDVTTWETGGLVSEPPPIRRTGSAPYYWDLFQSGGLWYAAHQSTDSVGQVVHHILVSPDLEHWAVYWRADMSADTQAQGSGPYHFVGAASDGKLHFRVGIDTDTSEWGHFWITPARARLVDTLLLHPAKTNMFSAAISTTNLASPWWSHVRPIGASPTIVNDTDETLAGETSVRHTLTTLPDTWVEGQTGASLSVAAALVSGTSYVGVVRAKVRKGTLITLRIGNTLTYYPVRRGEWQELVTLPFLNDGTLTRIWVGVVSDQDGEADFNIGALEIIPAPYSGEWSTGGAVQQAETLTHGSVTLASSWTLMGSAFLPVSTSDLPEGDFHLLRISKGIFNSIAVYGTQKQLSTAGITGANGSADITADASIFSAADVGRTIKLIGGGLTAGWYVITAVASGTEATVDRACATGVTPGDGYVYEFRWAMESTVSGSPSGSPAETGGRWLNRGQLVRWAVRCAKGKLWLSIMDGDGVEHAADVMDNAELTGVNNIIHGGAGCMPHELAGDLSLYDYCMSDAEVEEILGGVTYPAVGTVQYINPRNMAIFP